MLLGRADQYLAVTRPWRPQLYAVLGSSCIKLSDPHSSHSSTTNAIRCHKLKIYRGADKSLARPGRKQARKHVKDARDFNNIETRAIIKVFFSCKARHLKKFTPFWQKHYLISFLVELRTYQHPCIGSFKLHDHSRWRNHSIYFIRGFYTK